MGDRQHHIAALVKSIEAFSVSTLQDSLGNAARGWRFASDVDTHFIQASAESPLEEKRILSPPVDVKIPNIKGDPSYTPASIIGDMLAITDALPRWDALTALTSLHHPALVHDSFARWCVKQAKSKVSTFLSANKINIVIIGAGPCGLFLANILKYNLGDTINVLVCENRAYGPRLKKPYSRRWLTNLPLSFIGDQTAPDITKVLEPLGYKNYMGVTINIFETLLWLSCKKLGVKILCRARTRRSIYPQDEHSMHNRRHRRKPFPFISQKQCRNDYTHAVETS